MTDHEPPHRRSRTARLLRPSRFPDHHADEMTADLELAERVLVTRRRMVETALRLADELSAEKTKEATL